MSAFLLAVVTAPLASDKPQFLQQFAPLIVLVAAIPVAGILLRALLRSISSKPTEAGGYRMREALLTPAELSFFGVLQGVSHSQEWLVCPKVRLLDIIEPGCSRSHGRWRSAFNKVCAKHVDFLLCHRHTLRPLLAIELDDRTHLRSDRMERDNFVDGALRSAGVPILHVRVQRSYSSSEMHAAIAEKLGGSAVGARQNERSSARLLAR